jgi:hypothetical protein
MKIQAVVSQEWELDIDMMAKCFAELDDESQADFFIKVAAYAKEHYKRAPENQWWYIGRHLRTCTCATEDAREMVRTLAAAVDSASIQEADGNGK